MSRMWKLMCLSALCVSMVSGEILVKSGERIAFLGDSITFMGNRTTGYVNLVMTALQANGVEAVKIAAGICGNKSDQMLARLERDILNKKPHWMLVSCGVNDVMHARFNQGIKLEDYQRNMTQIVDRAQKAGIKVVILTATMIQEDQNNADNQRLLDYNKFLRTLASERKCILVDLNQDMQKMVAEGQKKYPRAFRNIATVDGVHMNPMGDMMMARGVLKGLGLSDEQMKKGTKAWQQRKCNFETQITLENYEKLDDLARRLGKPVAGYVYELVEQAAKNQQPLKR